MSLALKPADIAIIVVYMAVVIILGVLMKRRAQKSLGSYFLGDRQLPWWALAMSGSSSYFDITGTMWIVELFFTIGLRGMWVQWIWGFPITVFYMAYMGAWIRRSRAMTGSEWMETRFGSDKPGEWARVSYTIYAVLTITAFLAYGSIGMGKFGSVYLNLDEHLCAVLIIGLTGIYVVLGGFRGVVLVEVFQTVVLSTGALIVAYLGFRHVTWETVLANRPTGWGTMAPGWTIDYLRGGEYYCFGLLALVWITKGLLLDLSGPEQLYDFQRFLAARTPREASKLGALWGVIHTIRWPMAMSIAALAIVGLGGVDDPEKVLPMVIREVLPVGLRGLAIAALLSGFLATFNSTVNGGSSYLVKDIFHKYIYPQASNRTLIYASYASSALLIVVGLFVGFFAGTINQMFTWIMGTLGAGVLLPNVLRWYWWRVNGQGYAAGALAGMVLSLVQAIVPPFATAPLYITFPIITISVLIVTLVVTLLTPPTDETTLLNFYRTVQPAGVWGPIARRVQELDPEFHRYSPFSWDLLNVALGLPCLLAMYVFPIYLVLHRYDIAGLLLVVVGITGVALYFTWYRRLPIHYPDRDEIVCEEETSL
ncbi:MAG: sodium:solute symporter family protein [Candidatus Zipacnadales bacterium]